MASVVFPQGVRRMATEGKSALKYLYERSVGLMLGLVAPVVLGVVLLPGLVIELIAGDKYLSSVHLLQLTILYSLISPFTRQFGTIMDSLGKPQINFVFVLCITLINTTTNYFCIQSFGVIGAAYGTLASMFMALIFAGIILRREIDISYRNVLIYTVKAYRDIFTMAAEKTGIVKQKQERNL